MTGTRGWARRTGDWLRLAFEGWREHAGLRRELEALHERGELDRALTDAGLSPSDVPRLMQAHPQTPQQLGQMMRHLGIDRGSLPHDAETAAELRAMEWRCGECVTWRRCRHWLAAGDGPEEYRAFCPNVVALDELRRARAAGSEGSDGEEPHGVLAELDAAHGEGR